MTRTTEELQAEMARALRGHVADPDALAAGILEAFARIRDPEVRADISIHTDLLTLGPAGFAGVSVKPGNIRLNWRRLFEKTPELVLAGAGVTQVWLIPFAALCLWNLVRSLATVRLSPDHGTVMYALWHHDVSTRRFEEEAARGIVNAFRAAHELPPLGVIPFGELVSDLARLGCVEITDGRLWLREWTQRAH